MELEFKKSDSRSFELYGRTVQFGWWFAEDKENKCAMIFPQQSFPATGKVMLYIYTKGTGWYEKDVDASEFSFNVIRKFDAENILTEHNTDNLLEELKDMTANDEEYIAIFDNAFKEAIKNNDDFDGIFWYLKDLYKSCDNKELFFNMFDALTGIEFNEYLNNCLLELKRLEL